MTEALPARARHAAGIRCRRLVENGLRAQRPERRTPRRWRSEWEQPKNLLLSPGHPVRLPATAYCRCRSDCWQTHQRHRPPVHSPCYPRPPDSCGRAAFLRGRCAVHVPQTLANWPFRWGDPVPEQRWPVAPQARQRRRRTAAVPAPEHAQTPDLATPNESQRSFCPWRRRDSDTRQ